MVYFLLLSLNNYMRQFERAAAESLFAQKVNSIYICIYIHFFLLCFFGFFWRRFSNKQEGSISVSSRFYAISDSLIYSVVSFFFFMCHAWPAPMWTLHICFLPLNSTQLIYARYIISDPFHLFSRMILIIFVSFCTPRTRSPSPNIDLIERKNHLCRFSRIIATKVQSMYS